VTDLDIRDSTILKGLAMVAIVLHNFFHIVSPAGQNEFVFNSARSAVFLNEAKHPELAIQAFFSFFGHFGVQIFIFLSAFGLAKSHWDDPCTWSQFMLGRVKKLYPTIMLIVVPWACAMSGVIGPLQFIRHMGPQLATMLLGVSTLFGFALPPVGPWWFIPFIMQFYAVWPLLRRIAMRFGWQGLLVLSIACVALTQLANPMLARWSINLLTTPLGRMPGLCFGIVAARYPVRITAPVAAAGLAVLILGSMYGFLFPFTFFGVLLAALWTYMRFRDGLRNSRLLVRIGQCSMLIFLLNAIVRNQLVRYTSTPALQLYWGFLSAAVSIATANLIARLLQPQRKPSEGSSASLVAGYPSLGDREST
jgi:peptidoglycan/LPS O-acetylase OafA/YrhL